MATTLNSTGKSFYSIFMAVTELSEMKPIYKRLAHKNHPDTGGTVEDFQQLGEAFLQATNDFSRTGRNRWDKPYTVATEMENAQAFMDKIEDIFQTIEGLASVDIVGDWIWLSNTNKDDKDKFMKLNFKWSSSKKMWYWEAKMDSGEWRKKRTKSRMSYDQICDFYGKTTVEREEKKKIN